MERIVRLAGGILFIVVFLMLSNCSTNDSDEPVDLEEEEPGFGASQKDPVGTPLSFPQGVGVVGNTVHTPDFCLSPDSLLSLLMAESRESIKGSPGFFTVCVTLSNSNPFPVTITCPAGVTFICERDERERPKAQNGITVVDVVITIRPNSTETFLLDLYCLNSGRTRPAVETSFVIGPVTQNPRMQNLISILQDKNIQNDELGTDWIEVSTMIQQAVWEIADGKDLSSSTLEAIEGL